MRGKLVLLLTTVAVFLLANTITLAQTEQPTIVKVGKKAEVSFTQEHKIGDAVLAPGSYKLKHRVEGEDHFVQFTRLTGQHYPYHSHLGAEDAGEFKCRLEPLSGKASRTAITVTEEGGVRRISRVEVRGETVAHLF